MQNTIGFISFLVVIATAIIGGMDLEFYWVAVPTVIGSILYPLMNIDGAVADMQRGVIKTVVFYLITQFMTMSVVYWIGWLVGYFFR